MKTPEGHEKHRPCCPLCMRGHVRKVKIQDKWVIACTHCSRIVGVSL